MKKSFYFIIGFSSLGFIFPIGLYLFSFCGPLSSDQNIWSNFGSFIGGLSGSVFSFLSFIAVIIGLNSQIRENKDARDEADKQKEEAKKDKKIHDYMYLEEIISKRLEELLPYYKLHFTSLAKENMQSFPSFEEIAFLLQNMKEINAKIISIDPNTPVIEFYKRRYKDYVEGLFQKKIIEFNEL